MSGTPNTAYILDASVAAKWFTRHDEADREKAVALRTAHETGRCSLIVPGFALLEVLNAIRYSGRAREEDAAEALALLEKLRIEIIPLDWEALRRSAEIAWSHAITLYDAAYVALAERLGVPLLTADEAMAGKMKSQGLVARLSSLSIL